MQVDVDGEGALDALLQGREVGDAHRAIAAFAKDVWAANDTPPPNPSPALAAVLRGSAPRALGTGYGLGAAVAGAHRRPPGRPRAGGQGGLGGDLGVRRSRYREPPSGRPLEHRNATDLAAWLAAPAAPVGGPACVTVAVSDVHEPFLAEFDEPALEATPSSGEVRLNISG